MTPFPMWTRAIRAGAQPPAGPVVRSQAGGVQSADDRRILAVASTQDVDRTGDVILASGWRLDAYRKNPVVLWQHRHDSLPIGRAVQVAVAGRQLLTDIELANTSFAKTVQSLVRNGFLRALSVGFLPLDWVFADDGGVVVRSAELLEISLVNVPANAFALASRETNAERRRWLDAHRVRRISPRLF